MRNKELIFFCEGKEPNNQLSLADVLNEGKYELNI